MTSDLGMGCGVYTMIWCFCGWAINSKARNETGDGQQQTLVMHPFYSLLTYMSFDFSLI